MPADTPATRLATELVDHRLATDHEWALWMGDLTYLERWPDVSPEGLAEQARAWQSFAVRAAALPPTSSSDATLLETIAFTASAQATQMRWREELMWVNPAMGMIPTIFTFLPRYPLVTAEHGQRYLAKLAAFPAFVDQWIDRLRAADVAPIEHLVSAAIALLDRHLAAPLSQGPLGRQAAPTGLDGAAAEAWRAEMHAALDSGVAGAVGRLRETLRAHTLPMARPDDQPGLVHLPGGAELYEQLVRAHTTIDVDAAAVHEIGLVQVARLESEYRAIAGPIVGTEDVATIHRTLREDASLHYTDVEALVADATAALARATAAAPGWFGVLPQAPCLAESIEQGPLAFYSRPARDGSKPGVFFFNTSDPSMWATFQLQAVTYHEGVPGHHLQLAIAQEDADMHPLLADYYIAAYNEGWGLYTERLSDEMGLYSSALDRVGMLSADSMRACRLVVDTGMHALGWTRDQAIDYMLDNSPMSRVQVTGEVDRYIGSPGQALGYMMGRLEIDRLRSEAKAQLGERFDLSDFHDVVLSTGSVPMSTLTRVVGEWLEG